MLENIKNMINQKTEYLEAAKILFDEATEVNIDNLIVLNESAHDDEDDKEDEEIDKEDNEEKDDDEEEEDNNAGKDDSGEDLDNLPLEDDSSKEDPEEKETDDLLDSSIEDDKLEPSLSGDDDLPAPAAAPQGDEIDDFLNVSIGLGSNTMTDVLPIPPDNASEAISDDILGTRVDSGFDEESTPAGAQPGGFPMEEDKEDDILEQPIGESTESDKKEKPYSLKRIDTRNTKLSEKLVKTLKLDPDKEYHTNGAFKHPDVDTTLYELSSHDDVFFTQSGKMFKYDNNTDKMKPYKESADSFLEAISLDGDGGSEESTDKPADKEEAPDAGAEDDTPAEGESEVTAAVKDKVAEADTAIDGGGGASGGKEALLKKLGSLTKGLEDAKKAVMDTIQ
jgi:hypothetical protein